MGLFNTIREKAADLLSGVTDKAGELAGDLPGADMLQDLGADATDAAGETTDQAAETVQDLGADATDAAENATNSVTDATDRVTDIPGEPPQP